MPIYEYRCENGHLFEVMQRMSDEPLTSCGTCEAPVQRVFHPVAVHFKGSGFYNTDYGKKSKKGEAGGDSKPAEGGSPDKKTESKPDSKPDSKPAAASSD